MGVCVLFFVFWVFFFPLGVFDFGHELSYVVFFNLLPHKTTQGLQIQALILGFSVLNFFEQNLENAKAYLDFIHTLKSDLLRFLNLGLL